MSNKCLTCNMDYEYKCRFNHAHTHDNKYFKYCPECDICQEDPLEYDYCVNCNTKCMKDYNAQECDKHESTKVDRLINCEVCMKRHSLKFSCTQCDTCSWEDAKKHIYHCKTHDVCHDYKSKLNIFNNCTRCNKCCIKLPKPIICTDCEKTINHERYCKHCDSIHSWSLSNYKHCVKCKRCYNMWNPFEFHFFCLTFKFSKVNEYLW